MTKAKTLATLVSNNNPLADGIISVGDVIGLQTGLDAKQTALVSGTNIKTVNGTSILGSGNIQIDGGVTSFNTRTGAVTLSSGDVTGALGYTPLSDATSYLPLSGGTMTGAITFAGAQTWPTFNQSTTGSAATLTTGRTIGMTGDVTWTSNSFNGSANVTGTATLANSGVTAGTYTKVTVDAKGRVTTGASLASADLPTYTGTLTSSQITTGLGYTPYNSTNPNGYITGITSGQVTTALGYTPYQIRGVTTNLDTAASGIWRVDTGATGQPSGTYYGTVVVFDNASDTGFQFASDYSSANLWWRSGNAASMGGSGSWGAWRAVLHSGNYNSYSPTLTGGGASGTWGISISGDINKTQGTFGYSGSGLNIDVVGQGGPQVLGQGGGAAMISLHRPGYYAINFGLGTDNQLRTGGWSRGGNYIVVDTGNYNSAINRGYFNRETNGGTMVSGQTYSIYTGGGAVGMYLPTAANSAQGDRIVIHNLLLQWATYPFYVYMNTNTRLMNLNETMTCNINVGSIVLVCAYHDGTAYWNVAPGG